MFKYLPYPSLTRKHLDMLESSLNAAPEYERTNGLEFLSKIVQGLIQVYEIPSGLIAVELKANMDKRWLSVAAIYSEMYGVTIRGIIKDLKRLAKEWDCSHIETCVYDVRLMQAILHYGAVVESANLRMEVDDGQQEKDHHHEQLNADRCTTVVDAGWATKDRGTG